MRTKRSWVFKAALIGIAALYVPAVLISCRLTGGYSFNRMVWNDEFNGSSVSSANWTYDIGTGADKGLVGWGNNELQYYTDRGENVRIEDFADGSRGLVIEARKESSSGSNYTSARLTTQSLQSFTNGRIESRIKLPEGQGLWPAFWMLGSNIDSVGWPVCGEIDIMEYKGQITNQVHGTIHYGDPYDYSGTDYILPGSGDFSNDFHVFSLEWEPGEIRWYVDGTLYSRQNNWHSSLSGSNAPFDRPFFLLLNVAVGGNFVGSPDGSTVFPQSMYVDWVRVYQ
ncbi:MAG: glycoside hydrolase family 16 protein [Spirochaetaceae bacterium]|nr:glycoside hydrolase family 16 protein [Spirochaetaceae bacterium]MDT8296698.1 glycoside hydrolase family 16 protein [Spirochaetaceae bacterium]